jgi:flavin reductase (DIM6/NTAB) family NADH-FMN oxidoreductase RutF
LAAVLGRLPSGLFILTARRDNRETGMLASWIMQAGFDPPMLTVALGMDRVLGRWLAEGTKFAVNVLADHQRSVLGHFGRGFEEDEPAFDGIEVRRPAHGIPVLTGTVGNLICEPQSHIDSGDHRIFLARIVSGHLESDRPPLVHVRKNGLKY